MKVTAYIAARVQVEIPDEYEVLDKPDGYVPWKSLPGTICEDCLKAAEKAVPALPYGFDYVEVTLVEGENTIMAEL